MGLAWIDEVMLLATWFETEVAGMERTEPRGLMMAEVVEAREALLSEKLVQLRG